MQVEDLFQSLTVGLKFNPKNNSEAIKQFTGKGNGKVRNDIDILQALSEKPLKRVKKNEEDQVDDNDEADENSFLEESGTELSNIEEINAFRNKLHIRVKGEDVPAPLSNFSNMPLNERIRSVIIENIEKSDWKDPTPVQMQAISCLLNNRDVIASAPTGSGKTAAFVIPILSLLSQYGPQKGETISSGASKLQALILVPTKELAEQIFSEVNRLSSGKKLKVKVLKSSVNGNIQQTRTMLASVELLISTPMRLLGALRQKAVDLSRVRIVVLDEVDKLFEHDTQRGITNEPDSEDEDLDNTTSAKTSSKKKIDKKITSSDLVEEEEHEFESEADVNIESSFLTQIDEIFSHCPSTCQRGLFSATISSNIEELSQNVLKNPIKISIGTDNTGASTIDQQLTFVGREDGKLLAIRQIIQKGLKPPALIFVQSVDRAKELFRELVYDGINVDVIHSDRTPQQREEVITRFRRGDIWVLICTDLMARGVDFKDVQMVINYDLPQTAVAYIHRIGRTGRAGKRGTAVTLFTEADMPNLRAIANVVKLSGCAVPDWMMAIKKLSTKDKRLLRRSAPERRPINTDAKYDTVRAAKKALIIKQSKQKKTKQSVVEE